MMKLNPDDLVMTAEGHAAVVLRPDGKFVRVQSLVDGIQYHMEKESVSEVIEHRPAREANPILPFAVGMCAGAALIFFKIGGALDREFEFVEMDECQGGILLVGPQKHDERVIDISTGRGGFCHVALYLCLTDGDGRPLAIDSRRRVGVQLRYLDEFEGRPVVFIPMSATDTAYARGRAIDRLGHPYRGRPGGMTCSEFCYDCLPRRIQTKINKSPLGIVTPNSIARAFEVPRNWNEMVA